MDPIRLSGGGHKLSHLVFTYDLLLFAEASSEHAEIIQIVLDIFCNNLGQKVSKDKIRVFF
jgi:hypothetical protein